MVMDVGTAIGAIRGLLELIMRLVKVVTDYIMIVWGDHTAPPEALRLEALPQAAVRLARLVRWLCLLRFQSQQPLEGGAVRTERKGTKVQGTASEVSNTFYWLIVKRHIRKGRKSPYLYKLYL